MFGKRGGHQPPPPPPDRIGLTNRVATPVAYDPPPMPSKAAYRAAAFLKEYEALCRRHSMVIVGVDQDGTVDDPKIGVDEGTPSELDEYFEECRKAHRDTYGAMPPSGGDE